MQVAWEFIAALLASPGLNVLAATERHADVASEVFAELPHLAGNILHDAHTAILMREHGIRQICTRDTDFSRFPFLEVIDPLRVSGQSPLSDRSGANVIVRAESQDRE